MTQTDAEKRAYLRGYNRGRDRAWRSWRKVIEIAAGWRRKAAEGYGGKRCDGCALWQRGSASTKWGFCSQDYNASPDLGWIWAEGPNCTRDAHLISHENAFCSNWLPLNAARDEALKERGK